MIQDPLFRQTLEEGHRLAAIVAERNEGLSMANARLVDDLVRSGLLDN